MRPHRTECLCVCVCEFIFFLLATNSISKIGMKRKKEQTHTSINCAAVTISDGKSNVRCVCVDVNRECSEYINEKMKKWKTHFISLVKLNMRAIHTCAHAIKIAIFATLQWPSLSLVRSLALSFSIILAASTMFFSSHRFSRRLRQPVAHTMCFRYFRYICCCPPKTHTMTESYEEREGEREKIKQRPISYTCWLRTRETERKKKKTFLFISFCELL